MQDKATLRKFYNQARENIPKDLYQHKSNSICNQLTSILNNCNNIAIYYPVNQEVNILPIVELLTNKNFYLPRVPADNQYLEFYLFENQDQLINNQFNIPEPDPKVSSKSNYQDLDAIIVPIVAFTKNNNRLGHGCGYYDRTLGMINKKFNNNNIKFIGVAFSEQQTDNLPIDTWDIDMELIISA